MPALSAAIGTADAMSAWPVSSGEAIHTSTFLGNPVACAAALAQLAVIEDEGLMQRTQQLGARIRARTAQWCESIAGVRGVRGMGLLQGVLVEGDDAPAVRVMHAALAAGILLVPEGPAGDVVAITPPAAITDAQLDVALDAVEQALRSSLQPTASKIQPT